MSNLSLVADGYDKDENRIVLWGHGNYEYELETGLNVCRVNGKTHIDETLINHSYEEAMAIFKMAIVNDDRVTIY
tara:strand:+ start:496 stop:720 length:225 start_codon:yes stop_codon:yes gene_type:complete